MAESLLVSHSARGKVVSDDIWKRAASEVAINKSDKREKIDWARTLM
jgi:hypothetical protein